jgi:Protein of unknown function DUF262/Protein of unknown function (DUF1524)
MPLSFETKTMTVGELFSGSNVFCMPIFQRPYSWEEETALELFGDIDQAMVKSDARSSATYFLGPMIVAQSSSSVPFEIVDGQQRLVTLSAIFAILRDLLPPGKLQQELQESLRRPESPLRGLPEESRVRLRSVDQPLFEEWIQEPGGTLSLPTEGETEASERLLATIKAIKTEIGKVDKRYVERLSTFILNNCQVVRIHAQNLDDAYVLFRSLNSRGLPLNELDIIRAELVGSTAYDPSLAEEIADCWDEIQAEIGHDEFLKYVRTVISLIRTSGADADLRDVLRDLLRDPQAAVRFRQFLTLFLTRYIGLEAGTLEFGANTKEINRITACLRSLPFEDWRTPALIWLAKQPTPKAAYDFFKALEALSLGLFVFGLTRLQIARRFRLVTREVLDGTALTSNGALYLSSAEIIKLKHILEGPIPSRKKYLRHLLLRLNALMLHQDLPPHFPEDATIEHVLPQRPNGKSQWQKLYPEASTRKVLSELLGNYALLTGKINTSARNHDFNKKKEVIFALANVSMFPITASLTPYNTWNERDLRKRQADMLNLLRQVLPV